MVLLEDLGVVAAGELEVEELDEVGLAVGEVVDFSGNIKNLGLHSRLRVFLYYNTKECFIIRAKSL